MPTDARPSASSPTPIAETPPGGFPLSGPSQHPDPRTHAYRQDLADIALAGTVIASHYAEPMQRQLAASTKLFEAPADDAAPLADLKPGTVLRILDRRSGWAWGYADGLVGYIPATTLRA